MFINYVLTIATKLEDAHISYYLLVSLLFFVDGPTIRYMSLLVCFGCFVLFIL